eukprot:2147888-Pleurochrysis_carterae.AAC.2
MDARHTVEGSGRRRKKAREGERTGETMEAFGSGSLHRDDFWSAGRCMKGAGLKGEVLRKVSVTAAAACRPPLSAGARAPTIWQCSRTFSDFARRACAFALARTRSRSRAAVTRGWSTTRSARRAARILHFAVGAILQLSMLQHCSRFRASFSHMCDDSKIWIGIRHGFLLEHQTRLSPQASELAFSSSIRHGFLLKHQTWLSLKEASTVALSSLQRVSSIVLLCFVRLGDQGALRTKRMLLPKGRSQLHFDFSTHIEVKNGSRAQVILVSAARSLRHGRNGRLSVTPFL